MRHPIVYLFGPIDSCPDPLSGLNWKQEVAHKLSAIASVYNPASAWGCGHAGQELVEINEFVVDHATLLIGCWMPGSVGSCREVERAIAQGKKVLAVVPERVNCKSPYFNDERITFCTNFEDAIMITKKLLSSR